MGPGRALSFLIFQDVNKSWDKFPLPQIDPASCHALSHQDGLRASETVSQEKFFLSQVASVQHLLILVWRQWLHPLINNITPWVSLTWGVTKPGLQVHVPLHRKLSLEWVNRTSNLQDCSATKPLPNSHQPHFHHLLQGWPLAYFKRDKSGCINSITSVLEDLHMLLSSRRYSSAEDYYHQTISFATGKVKILGEARC